MSPTSLSKLFATLVVASAILAPAASAMPIDYHPAVGEPQTTRTQPPTTIPLTAGSTPGGTNAATGGFDWGDAALGAGGMLILLSGGAAAVVTIRRRGRSHTLVTG